MLSRSDLISIFTLQQGKRYLRTRESSTIEFKESFNLAGLAEYAKDFASFANNSGGYIVFGVKNKPHIPIGLRNERFAEVDEARITEFVNQHFTPAIKWEKGTYTWKRKTFGVFHIHESRNKPVITTNDGGQGPEIKNGEIYYRYIGRSEKIRHAELKQIIEERMEQVGNRWRELFKKIGKIGPENAAILDTVEGRIEEGDRIMLIDDTLIQQLKFIREGQFKEKEGAITLKLVGELHPVSVVGVQGRIIHDDPYIFKPTDVVEQVTKAINKPFNVSSGHVKCWKYYKARGSYDEGKLGCNPKYCDYKEALSYFMYTKEWIDFLISELSDQEKFKKIMSTK
ncbi:ATP-binding protein [Chloroflexota bacterium]